MELWPVERWIPVPPEADYTEESTVRSKLVVVCASTFIALGLSLAGHPAAQADQAPGTSGEIAGKPQGVQGEATDKTNPKAKPKTKPKSQNGKGKQGDKKGPAAKAESPENPTMPKHD